MYDKKINNSPLTRVKWKIALYSSFSSESSSGELGEEDKCFQTKNV